MEKSERPLNKEQILKEAEQYLTGNALILLKMQLYHTDHKKKWEKDEKYFALGLYYRSPKAYKFLRNEKGISLPCLSLMKEWVNELSFKPGINVDLFKLLGHKSSSMSLMEKECVMQFDEMSLRAFLEFNSRDDYIEGFVDLGSFGRTNEQATHVIVFMVSGLSYNWKQAVYFAFCKGTVKGDILAKMILEVIDAVEKAGFIIRMMVCDQGPSNQKAAAELNITHDNPFIIRNNHKIYFIFDQPHVFKCWRNNLLANDYIIGFGDEAEIVSWSAIEEFFKLDSGKSCKAAPKLTNKHIHPDKFEIMNVKLAVQVFSASVARGMMTASRLGLLKNEHCESTAKFIWVMNNIFDCLNARHPHDKRHFARGLNRDDPTVENYLKSVLPFVESVSMLKVTEGKNNCRIESRKYLDCFTNLALTIKSILALWDDLKKEGRHYLLTGKLNQDTIENFFAFMRALSGFNKNPTCMQLRKNFQHACVTTLLFPPPGANCKPDEYMNLLTDFEEILKKDKKQIEANEEQNRKDLYEKIRLWIEEEFYDNENAGTPEEEDENPVVIPTSLHLCAQKYVAGYIAGNCIKKFKCVTCTATLIRENKDFENDSDMLIFWKAYKVPNKECGNLIVPSDHFFDIIQEVYKLFEKHFDIHKTEYNLSSSLTGFIEQMINKKYPEFFEINQCVDHRKYCIKFFVKVHIFNFLKWISREFRDNNRSNNSTNKPSDKLNNLKNR